MIDEKIVRAIQLAQSGARAEARRLFQEIYDAQTLDPVSACVLSHYKADTQENPRDELRWDPQSLHC